MLRDRLVLALFCLAATALCHAQEPRVVQSPAPEPEVAPPILRITVTMIQVDAVVTNSAGKHVAGLLASDFEILQDGVPQKISYFSYMRGPAQAGQPETPADPKAKAVDRVPVGPPPPITAAQVRRTVALVVDDLALGFEDLVRVREGLRQYVERHMQPGDLVALVRTGGGIAILEQFTTDRRVLLEAIDLLKWHFAGRVGTLAITPVENEDGEKAAARSGRRGDPEVLDYGRPLRALGALGTIEQVIDGMKGLPGRKSIVYFSDGIRIDADVNAAIDKVTDMANRAAVSLYTVDPGGLRTRERERREDPRIYSPDTRELERFPQLPGIEDDEFGMQAGLEALARRTGGLFYHDRNDIPECIGDATDDQLNYYLLGYSPKEGTFEKEGGKTRFHRVVVRMRHPELKVRWKSGFNGVTDELITALPPLPKTREQQLLDALASPFAANDIKVRLTSSFNQTKNVGPMVHSLLHFGGRELAFRKQEDGTWHATVDVVTSAFRGVKQPMEQGQRRLNISLTEEQYQKALHEGFLLNLVDRMKQPGTFLMRAVVRDAVSERIGSASQYVQVPDTRKGQLAVTGIFLKLAPPELRSPTVTPAENEGSVQEWSEGGPATRRYRPGQAILYGFAVVNAKAAGSARQYRVGNQIRLFRNGKIVYTGKYSNLLEPTREDGTRLIGGGVLSLGGRLSLGEYLLQVIVTDENAGKKKPPVVQWIDFEVVGRPAA